MNRCGRHTLKHTVAAASLAQLLHRRHKRGLHRLRGHRSKRTRQANPNPRVIIVGIPGTAPCRRSRRGRRSSCCGCRVSCICRCLFFLHRGGFFVGHPKKRSAFGRRHGPHCSGSVGRSADRSHLGEVSTVLL
jgi:hypothetical protein